MSRALPLLIGSSLALLGCSRADDARRQFGVQFSCPEDRVEVRPRTDVKWSSIVYEVPKATPPAELAKDPARLAKWKADQKALYQPLLDSLDSADVFEGEGCSHTALIGCIRLAKRNGPGPLVNCEVASEKAKDE